MIQPFKISAITICLLFTACQPSTKQNPDPFYFQETIDKEVIDNMPGILLSVCKVDSLDSISWSGASGYADRDAKIKVRPDQTFRIASVTKTFVAATVLRLWEEGKLNLNDPISDYISQNHINILKSGNYNPDEISIYQLLTHTSGLSEHTHSHKYELDYLSTNPIWTRTEQIEDLVKYTKPVGQPGAQYSYSDTGYLLLGELIETVTNRSMGEAIIEQLKLDDLGLSSIKMETVEGDFSGNRIHQYYQGEDTYYINPTLDYFGGGGLLANTADLCLFFQYLFNNKVFKNAETLDTMLRPVKFDTQQSLDYRLGIWRTEINGFTAFTHSGFWGTQVVYIPELKTSIAVNYSQKWDVPGPAPVLSEIANKLN